MRCLYHLRSELNSLRHKQYTWIRFSIQFIKILISQYPPGSILSGKTPLFFRYSGVNAANAGNLLAKRR